MAIKKITKEQRDLMKLKSAQSLPDVPSSRGYTPKQFKDAITKPMFDNENSFYAFINAIVDSVDMTKADKEWILLNYYNKTDVDNLLTKKVNVVDLESNYYDKTTTDEKLSVKAKDSEVVHKEGSETINGAKTFNNPVTIKGSAPFINGINRVAMRVLTFDQFDCLGEIKIHTPLNNDKGRIVELWAKDTEDSNYQIRGMRVEKDGIYYYNDWVDQKLASIHDLENVEKSVREYADSLIANLIDGAPDILNTFKEVADYIESDQSASKEMLANINKNKQSIEETNKNILTNYATKEYVRQEIDNVHSALTYMSGTTMILSQGCSYRAEDETIILDENYILIDDTIVAL